MGLTFVRPYFMMTLIQETSFPPKEKYFLFLLLAKRWQFSKCPQADLTIIVSDAKVLWNNMYLV